MKRSTILSILILVSMVLVILPAPMAAQGPDPAGQSKVPSAARPAVAPLAPQPEWGGAWQYGPDTGFQFTRFDGGYYPVDGMVYFMGGRLADNSTDGSVWSFDPVAGTYADMGVDLVTPISNYKMHLLQDETGAWAFYVLCGRPAPGGVIASVQAYYPDTNTTVQLDPADDYPGAVSCTSGVQVVYDNKVWVAGGFDGTANHAETWVFDPTAAMGSKWSQVASANLSLARAYMTSAVVDDLIYAIGGAWFDGATLINVPTVEVLDPNAASPVWDDGAAADLPEDCSSSRAWGFNSDSPYLDPDGTPLAGKIVSACGFWSDENDHVNVYDTGLDFWEAFPYLQTDRRDEAGEFIPPVGGARDNGMPGMWVWGGRQDTDANVLVTSEYYEVLSGPEVSLIPPFQIGIGEPGATVVYTVTLLNLVGFEETFDLTYDSDWLVSGPATVGPVAHGAQEDFLVEVTVPADAECYDVGASEVTAAAQSDPSVTDTASIETTAVAGGGNLEGHVYDANTSDGILNAYVYVEVTTNDDVYFETWTDGNGYYLFEHIPGCSYIGDSTALGYYGQSGVPISIQAGMTTTQDIYLDAAMPELSDSEVHVSVPPTSTDTYDLMLTNNGTGDLHFHVTEVSNEGIYPLPLSAPTMPSGVDPQVYADLADSPDGTAKFIVYLREQADLSAAFAIRDRSARGQYVLNALQSTAQRSQASLRADLDRAGAQYEPHYIANALVVTGDVGLVDSIAARPEVAFVAANGAIPAPEPVEMDPGVEDVDAVVWNIAWVNADDVWSTFGATGEGIVVSNIDTGVLYTHTALVDAYRGNEGGGTFDHNYNWWDPYGDQPLAPYDYHSHGSHTIGTMVGGTAATGEEIGMAPGGQWIACNGFDQGGSGYDAELLECAEFILAPWDLTGANPDPDMRPDVVNNSWGGGPTANWWYNQAVYAWRAAGIFPVFSAGNDGDLPEGPCDTAGYPGAMENVMAVGATGYETDTIAGFSSRGPADITGIMKPQVSAPGVRVISAGNDGNVREMGGTSMAAPHVGGEAALIWSAVPELRGDVQLTYWIIEQSAMGITTDEGCGGDGPTDIPNNTYGWGRIDAFEAVSLALSSEWDVSWLDVTPVDGVVAPMDSADITLDFDTTGLTLDECYTSTLKVEYNDPYVVEEFVPVELCVTEPAPSMFYVYLPVVVKNH